jgi:hypothetical protein
VLGAALAVGSLTAYVDSRTTWDDAGVTALAVFLAAAILTALRPRSLIPVALAVGGPVVAFNVVLLDNYGSVMALAVALIGAGMGYMLSTQMRK